MTIHTAEQLDLACLPEITIAEGPHHQRGSQVCIMEAASWLAGAPHSDHPDCVSPVIGAFLRRWNDDLPTDEDRNRLLKPLLSLIINTSGTAEVEERRSWLVLDWLVRTLTPAWFDLVPALSAAGRALRTLPALTDRMSAEASLPTIRGAGEKSAAARDAARDAAGAAAWDAAWDAAWVASRAAARDAARVAAGAAARAAAWDAAWVAARNAAWDALEPTTKRLQESAVELVRALCAVA